MLTFKDLQYFDSVVRLGSISAAAQEQFISQPAMSMSIKKIEKYFHTSLFYRNKSSVILTEHGQQLYPSIQNLLKLQNELIYSFSGNRSFTSINIAIFPIPLYKSLFYLAKLLFNNIYPDIEVNIFEHDFSSKLDPQSYFFICFSPQINNSPIFNQRIHNIPHLKVQEIMVDHFNLIYNKNNRRSSNSPTKIGTLFSLETLKQMPSFDEKKILSSLKKLGFTYKQPIVYLDALYYDQIIKYVYSDSSCFALLPQNFIRPYNDYMDSLAIADLQLFSSHHYIAYNGVSLKQFPQAQVFLDVLISEAAKYI